MRTIINSIFGLLLLFSLPACFLDKEGCTDPNAVNYDSKAENDDGTCEYADPAGTQFITIMKRCVDDNAIDFSAGIVECDTCVGPPNDRGTDIFYNGSNFL